MTNQHLLDIYLTNLPTSVAAALRGVWNAGFYEGKGITPTATSPDRSGSGVGKPVAVVKIGKV